MSITLMAVVFTGVLHADIDVCFTATCKMAANVEFGTDFMFPGKAFVSRRAVNMKVVFSCGDVAMFAACCVQI